ncbi:unnamed protein product, partial [Polarella glacialis]
VVNSVALGINIDNPGDINDFYRIGKKLGEGNFGSVAKAAVKATGAVRAIKTIPIPPTKDERRLDFLRHEIKISKMVDHPSIIKLFEVFENNKKLHLVLELCRNGDLWEYMKSSSAGSSGLSEFDSAVVMQQLLRGVHYMHRSFICHRDLKAQNMLLTFKSKPPTTSTKSQPKTSLGKVAALLATATSTADNKESPFENSIRITDFGLSCNFNHG